MSHTRPDPTPKPDHIRSLRDLAANFVRAIDRTALEFEGTATAELTERVACLVALHELDGSELARMTTKDLRSRVAALQQVRRIMNDYQIEYEVRHMTNGELRKRIEYLRQFNEVKNLDDLSDLEKLPDDVLTAVSEQVSSVLRQRKAKAKAEAKAQAKATPARFPALVQEEDDADVTDIIGDEENEAA